MRSTIPASVTPHDLAEMMVGSELPSPETRGGKVSDVAELVLDDVTVSDPEGGRPLVDHVSLTVHKGEVVGIAGVEGNGQSELVHAILGLAAATGSISAAGSDITGLSTRQRRALGIGYIAEDRQKEGLVLTFTIWENAALGHQHQRPFGRGPWIDKAGARRRAEQIIDTFDVRTPGTEAPTFTMSGGNQQKLVVGREMTMEPSILIASHPTRGVDVGAQALIWDVIRSSPRTRHGDAPHLGRPGGTHRTVRPPPRHAAGASGRRPRPGQGDAGRSRFVHDRRPNGGLLMFERIWRASLAPLAATAAAIVISSIALLIAGHNPLDAFREMWQTIDSTESVVLIINRAVPYYIAGVAVAIGFKMNLFNIGSNGQYLLATLIAGWAGAQVSLPPPIHVAFVFLVAITVGGTWALIAAILNVTRNVNVVISTIMLNYIAIGLVAFLLNEFLADESTGGLVKNTELMPTSARLPSLNKLIELTGFDFAPGVNLFGFLPFAILLGVGYHVLLNRSRFGFELRLSGLSPEAARSAGVNPKRMVLITLFMSGAIAGHDRPAVPARRPELPQVRRCVPHHHRFHRAGPGAARSEQSDRHRRGRHRVGDDRASDTATRSDRHPSGDRQDPAGVVPPDRRDRV